MSATMRPLSATPAKKTSPRLIQAVFFAGTEYETPLAITYPIDSLDSEQIMNLVNFLIHEDSRHYPGHIDLNHLALSSPEEESIAGIQLAHRLLAGLIHHNQYGPAQSLFDYLEKSLTKTLAVFQKALKCQATDIINMAMVSLAYHNIKMALKNPPSKKTTEMRSIANSHLQKLRADRIAYEVGVRNLISEAKPIIGRLIDQYGLDGAKKEMVRYPKLYAFFYSSKPTIAPAAAAAERNDSKSPSPD